VEAVIFDIDGTLADLTHRLHLVENGKRQWDLFFKRIPNDTPIKPIVDLASTLIRSNEKAILFITGRPERTRIDTVTWLLKQELKVKFETCLFMRKDGDRREDHIVKREILNDIRNAGFEPVLVFDDRQSVVDMWRQQGICVAQTKDRNF